MNALKKEKELPLLELAQSVDEILTGNSGQVSQLREHAIVSQLRTAIRHLGYKPRETREKPATLPELSKQLIACLNELKGESPEDREFDVRTHIKSVLSNLKADSDTKTTPELKEAPLPAGSSSPSPTPRSRYEEFKNRPKDELLEILKSTRETLAKEPNRADAKEVNRVVTQLLEKLE